MVEYDNTGYHYCFEDDDGDYFETEGSEADADILDEFRSVDIVIPLTVITVENTSPRTVKDLRKIAKARGIKYNTTMTKKELCTVLEVNISKPVVKLIFRNKETGEEHGFHSIYKASREMGVNPGLIHYYMGKEMTIGETTYTVSKV